MTNSIPAIPTRSAPKRPTSFGVFGATDIITTEKGSMRTAASSGVYPMTPCRYWASRKNVPNMAKKTSVIPPDETAKRGFWNNRRSSIGWLLRHSHTQNSTSTMAAPPNHSSDSTLAQPWLGASMMAYTSALRPTTDSSAPTGSSGVSVESLDLGTSTYPATRAPAMIGRLTRNTEPHQKCSSSRPEASGPRAAPLPEMPAQMAIALACSRRGKTLVRIDSVDGMTNAAPTPITALATISIVGSSAKAPNAEPAANTTRPACRAPLRPKRSPRAAARNSRPANTRP